MANNRNVWDYRDSLDSRMAKMETHVENIYHHVKRIDVLLEKQNGRIRTNEFTISRWKGVTAGIIAVSAALSTLIAMAMKQENTMDALVQLVQENWKMIALATLVIDKVVAMSPSKMDDLLWASAKKVLVGIKVMKKK